MNAGIKGGNMKTKRISKKGTGQHIMSNTELLQLLKKEKFIADSTDHKFGISEEEPGEGLGDVCSQETSSRV